MKINSNALKIKMTVLFGQNLMRVYTIFILTSIYYTRPKEGNFRKLKYEDR
jgi:hypothetical protein